MKTIPDEMQSVVERLGKIQLVLDLVCNALAQEDNTTCGCTIKLAQQQLGCQIDELDNIMAKVMQEARVTA